jgi:hypothetical protein
MAIPPVTLAAASAIQTGRIPWPDGGRSATPTGRHDLVTGACATIGVATAREAVTKPSA